MKKGKMLTQPKIKNYNNYKKKEKILKKVKFHTAFF
jgi:hypothetical protein